MKKDIFLLCNDNYKILNLIYENQIVNKEETFCSLSQEQMAQKIGLGRMTVNIILKRLTEIGLLLPRTNKLKRYQLSERGYLVINTLNNL